MKLKLTEKSLQYWQDNLNTAYRARLGLTAFEMLSYVSIQEVYEAIVIIKLPKEKTSHAQWYHIVNLASLLVVGRVRLGDLKTLRTTFDKVRWVLDINDPTRMTLLAYAGNVVATFHCNLQYEYVHE